MEILTRSQEMVLLAVWRLQDKAYGFTIRNEIKRMSGKTWAFGALFITLERLSKKGFLDSRLSDPTPERGGKSKRMYSLTRKAVESLLAVRNLQNSMWEGTPELRTDRS